MATKNPDEIKRWNALKEQSLIYQKDNGAPVTIEDFYFLLSIGGRLIEKNKFYIDRCYLHRAEIPITGDRIVYRFKTLTEKTVNFEALF
jgi:hypothetical protein